MRRTISPSISSRTARRAKRIVDAAGPAAAMTLAEVAARKLGNSYDMRKCQGNAHEISAGAAFAAGRRRSGRGAGQWPNRPIKAITTTSAGGLSDIFMRALGEELRQKLGQPLIVENRPGGAMNTGTRACADRRPTATPSASPTPTRCSTTSSCSRSMPFNPETSLQPITNAFHLIHMLVVNSKLGVKNVDELVALFEEERRHAVLPRAGPAAGSLHGDPEEGEGRRLGARAVPRRRRGGQRHPERLDADRPVRRRQRDRQRPRRPDDARW